ncbi:MAG: hypothetical protein K2Y18_07715 [Alphaproteobacteria bacterium]|jgi:hypothetical protein|nr:hypothetical protein [Alphaproteobacteria bacterium]
MMKFYKSIMITATVLLCSNLAIPAEKSEEQLEIEAIGKHVKLLSSASRKPQKPPYLSLMTLKTLQSPQKFTYARILYSLELSSLEPQDLDNFIQDCTRKYEEYRFKETEAKIQFNAYHHTKQKKRTKTVEETGMTMWNFSLFDYTPLVVGVTIKKVETTN